MTISNRLPVGAKVIPDWHRHDLVNLLTGSGNIGLELGVAEGIYSDRMVKSGKFRQFFGVDMYADLHDTSEYKRALKRIGLESEFRLLRMRFDEALDLFEDEYFDYIYVDGYAHSGEEGGTTIYNWIRKLKIGGVMAGDDYSDEWPLVIDAVNHLVKQENLDLLVTGKTESENYSLFPSWAVVKRRQINVSAPQHLVAAGARANSRVAKQRSFDRKLRTIRAATKSVFESLVNLTTHRG